MATVNYEFPLSIVAAYYLAESDKQYIELFLELLCLIDMDHEVYEGSYILLTL